MKRASALVRAAVLALFALTCVPATAVDLSEVTGESTPAPAESPDPIALRADWWRYLADAGAELEARSTETVAAMERVAASLPPEMLDEARDAVARLKANLAALARLREAAPPASEPLPELKASYRVEEWLRQLAELQQRNAELKATRDALTADEQRNRAALKRYDAQLAEHLVSRAEGDPAMRLQALALMADGAAIHTTELALTQRRLALTRLERAAAELDAHIGAMATRLDPAIDELSRLDTGIAELEGLLEPAQKRLRKAQLATQGVTDASDHFGNALTLQGVVVATLERALLMTRLESLRAERELRQLLDPGSEVDLDAVAATVRERTLYIENTRQELATLLRENRRLREQVLEALTQPDPSATLRKLDQQLVTQRGTMGELGSALDLLAVMNARVGEIDNQQRGWLRASAAEVMKWLGGASSQTDAILGASLFKLGDTPVTTYGLLRVVLIMAVALVVSRLLRRTLERIAERRTEADNSLLYTLGRLLHYLILVVGLAVSLSSIGLDFTNLAVVAGALSVGIGFGLQSVVNNFVSGLILLFERSLKVGDFIELDSGTSGVVQEINVRSTLINTSDNVDIIVPNSELVGGKVINWTLREAIRRIHVPFGVAYGTDKELTRTAALEAAAAVPHTLTGRKGREPQVWLVNFGESSLDYELVVWIRSDAVKRPGAVRAAYLWAIETALGAHGIEIPFPQRDLHLRSVRNEIEEALLARRSAPSGP